MKAQLFTLDFILGLLITIGAVLAAVVLLPTHEAPFTEDAQRFDTLMTEGVPEDWTTADVVRPGFLTDGRFNETKIAEFAGMPLYEQSNLLSLSHTFSITFSQNNTTLDLCSTCGAIPDDYSSLTVIRRYALLGPNVTTMEVLLYE